jgi:hypothetical protein
MHMTWSNGMSTGVKIRVCNAETSIHQCLRSVLVQGGIHTSSLFDRLDSTDRQLRT